MKALTLTQPWASLVAFGLKRFETRSWHTNYRGPLAIHAAKGLPAAARRLFRTEPFASDVRACGYAPKECSMVPWRDTYPLGYIVATCRLVEVRRIGDFEPPNERERVYGDWRPGRYAWELADVRGLEVPVRVNGALGLWEWSGTEASP